MNFTCNGSITRWIFAADFKEMSDSSLYSELQIWRPISDGQYSKVETTILMSSKNSSKIYYNSPNTPLHFKEGDIVGYYQSKGKHRIIFERVGSDHLVYYKNKQSSSSSTFNVSESNSNNWSHAFITVIAGEYISCLCPMVLYRIICTYCSAIRGSIVQV